MVSSRPMTQHLTGPAHDPRSDLYLRACRGEPVERVPVWIMRQAGRYSARFRAIRAKVDFLTLCKTPELAAEVTLQPVDEIGVDAAIVFADILLPLEAMGPELLFLPGKGPQFPEPVRSREDFARLRVPEVEESLGYVFSALRILRRELDGKLPLIGFGGTPWTLATYLVEGGSSKHFEHLLGWSWRDPEGLALLLDRIADTSLAYLRGQIDAGAQALQLFDTWGGILGAERWERIARPPLEKILRGLRSHAPEVPLVYYVRGGAHLLTSAATLPVDALGVDWRLPLSEVRRIVGPGKALQGNLDPTALLGPIDEIRAQARRLLREGAGGPHVANLGHGILPPTPVEHARAFVEAIQEAGSAEIEAR